MADWRKTREKQTFDIKIRIRKGKRTHLNVALGQSSIKRAVFSKIYIKIFENKFGILAGR